MFQPEDQQLADGWLPLLKAAFVVVIFYVTKTLLQFAYPSCDGIQNSVVNLFFIIDRMLYARE